MRPPAVRDAPFPSAAFEQDVLSKSFLGRRLMIMNRPEGVHRILVENAANYVRPHTAFRILLPPIGGGLFLAEGAEWRRQRRLFAPSFSPRAVPAFSRHVARHARALVTEFHAAGESEIAVFAPLQSLTLAVAAEALFSIDIRSYNEDIRTLARDYSARLAQPTMLDFLMPLGIPSPRDFPRRRFKRRWMALVARMIADRRQTIVDTPDMFDMMSESEIERGLFDQLVYTRAVIQEALRLYPPALSIVRQALADDVADGVAIPAGATVEMAPWVLHRHETLWPHPNVFDPTRFLAGRSPPARCAYIPFGIGQRACIGMQFALVEAVHVIAALVQAFHIEPTTDRPVIPAIRITLQPHNPHPFRFRPRRGVAKQA
jgi:unspecific monooxygenase